jgi:hypothetical protein
MPEEDPETGPGLNVPNIRPAKPEDLSAEAVDKKEGQ